MKSKNYSMHMARKNIIEDNNYATKIGGYVITFQSIESIPCVQITENKSLNLLIRQNHQNILRLSKNRKDGHKYDEVGYLLELIKPYNTSEPIYGYYNETTKLSSIKATKNESYKNFLATHTYNQLLFIHNHPNNSSLSYGDIHNLVMNDEIYAVSAVSNIGNVYVAYKNIKYNEVIMKHKFQAFNNLLINMSNNTRSTKINNLLRELHKNQDRYGITFKYSKRRN